MKFCMAFIVNLSLLSIYLAIILLVMYGVILLLHWLIEFTNHPLLVCIGFLLVIGALIVTVYKEYIFK